MTDTVRYVTSDPDDGTLTAEHRKELHIFRHTVRDEDEIRKSAEAAMIRLQTGEKIDQVMFAPGLTELP